MRGREQGDKDGIRMLLYDGHARDETGTIASIMVLWKVATLMLQSLT